MKKIVLASNNAGKVREINAMLADSGIEVVSQSEFNAPDVEETGLTFIENAILKARSAAKYSGLPSLADDSGLEVDALNGAPGIYSARYSGEGATDQKNLEKLLNEMQNVADDKRSARFHCVLVLMRHADDPTPPVFHGVWEGRITREPQGENGFGYDPVFFVPTHDCTAAQLPADEKNRLSHRGQALRQFIQSLK